MPGDQDTTLGLRVAALIMIALTASGAVAKDQTFTGEVSDTMCGAKHMMTGSAAECARDCASKGSTYALVVGDKVYALDSKDKNAPDQFGKLAGQKATVTGQAQGETITVTAITGAKR